MTVRRRRWWPEHSIVENAILSFEKLPISETILINDSLSLHLMVWSEDRGMGLVWGFEGKRWAHLHTE